MGAKPSVGVGVRVGGRNAVYGQESGRIIL
jgi:hypothetical protein